MAKFLTRPWLLRLVGGLLCIGLVTVVLATVEPYEIRRALAEEKYSEALKLYGLRMAERPSGRIANKMIDLAVSTDNRSLLFNTLQRDLSPHLNIRGVRKAFTRGGLAWLEGAEHLDGNTLWLYEQLAANGSDVGAEVRMLYRGLDAKLALEVSEWVNSNFGMDAEDLAFLSQSALNYIVQLPWPGEDIDPQYTALAQAQSILADAGMSLMQVDMLLNWQNMSAQEFYALLSSLSSSPTPIEAPAYNLLRALALAGYLDDGWGHPLIQDVGSELAIIYPNLPSQQKLGMFQAMHDKIPHGSSEELHLLLGVVIMWDGSISLESAELAAATLHTSAGSSISKFVNDIQAGGDSFTLDIPLELWSQDLLLEIATLFYQSWPLNRELQVWAALAEVVKTHDEPKMITGRVKEYQEVTYPLHRSWFHQALVFRDSRGVIIYDLTNWREIVLPGGMCALSPDGSRVLTLTKEGSKTRFRVHGISGKELSNFVLDIDINPRQYEFTWHPRLQWHRPDQAYIYFEGGTHTHPEPDFKDFYTVDISTKSYTNSRDLTPLRFLGQDLYCDWDWNIFDKTGDQVGNGGVLFVNQDEIKYELGNGKSIILRDERILLAEADKERDISPGIDCDMLTGVGIAGDAIFIQMDYHRVFKYSQSAATVEWLEHFFYEFSPQTKPISISSWSFIFENNVLLPQLINTNQFTMFIPGNDSYYLAILNEPAYYWGRYSAQEPLMLLEFTSGNGTE